MVNKKGQALVEFVIILPVMLLLVFCVIDFGMVIYEKNNLENTISDAVTLYENGKTIYEIKDIIKKDSKLDIIVEMEDNYLIMKLKKEIDPLTPGFNYLKNKIFTIESKRVIRSD